MKNESNQCTMMQKIIYSFTGAPIAIFKVAIGAVAVYYFTEHVGISMAAISLMLLLTRIWDAINDPLFGIISDNTKETKFGKNKMYYLISAIVGGLAFFLLYSIPEGIGEGAKIAWMYITYTMVGMALTVSVVSEFGIFTKMTSNPQERTTMAILKAITGAIGGLLIIVLIIPMVNVLGNGNALKGYSMQGMILALFFVFIAVMVSIFVPLKNKDNYSKSQKTTVIDSIKVVIKNKYAVLVITGNFFLVCSIIARTLGTPYFAKYVIGDEMFITYAGLSALAATLLILPLSKIFIKRFGSLAVAFAGVISLVVGNIAIFFAGTNMVGLLTASVVASMGLVLLPMTMRLLLADTADYGLRKFKQDSTGMIAAVFGAGGKLGNTLTPAIITAVLSATGFISASNTQIPEVVEAIRNIYTIVPAIISALIFIPLFIYKKSISKLQEDIGDNN